MYHFTYIYITEYVYITTYITIYITGDSGDAAGALRQVRLLARGFLGSRPGIPSLPPAGGNWSNQRKLFRPARLKLCFYKNTPTTSSASLRLADYL